MNKFLGVLLMAVLAVCAFVYTSHAASAPWTEDFGIDKADLVPTGSNPYFILEPGHQLYFKGKKGDLTITVLDETKTINGVETRVVEERETEDGTVSEVSRNYFAISKTNNSVFYFGEDQGGAWHAGENGAKAGLIMPGLVLLGGRHYQEIAPKVAMDRAEIVSMSETLQVPAGKFDNVLKIEETTPLEPFSKEYKYYARGIGLLRDGDMELVRYGFVKK